MNSEDNDIIMMLTFHTALNKKIGGGGGKFTSIIERIVKVNLI